MDDQYLVAMLIKIEIETALAQIVDPKKPEEENMVYKAALEAISVQYHGFGCGGECDSLQQQLEWMDNMQNWWDRKGRPLPNIPNDCSYCWDDAGLAINGYRDSQPAESRWWGNPHRGSERANYIKEKYPSRDYSPYSLIVDNDKFIVWFRGTEEGGPTGILDFIVVTKQQNDACGPTCMGFSSP